MRVAATWAQLACNKNLNKKMKTQLKNLEFYTTLVLAKAYSIHKDQAQAAPNS